MDNLRGAALMVVAMFGFALEDTLIKLMSASLPSGQILMMLGVGGTVVFAIWSILKGEVAFSPSFLRGASGVRAVCEGMAALGFVTALALAPLSLVTMIIQASPILVTFGAAVFFKETVGWRRWLAVVIGMIGVLIVIRPFGETFEPTALFAVMGVIFMSARDLATRKITQGISTTQVSAIGFMATIPAGALSLIVSGASPVVPSGLVIGQFLVAVAIGGPALYCVIAAMRIGEISFITPFRYTRIIFGLMAGMIVFSEKIDALTLVGAAIIVVSGIYTVWREARLRRMQQTVKPPSNA